MRLRIQDAGPQQARDQVALFQQSEDLSGLVDAVKLRMFEELRRSLQKQPARLGIREQLY